MALGVEPAVADRITEIDSMISNWTTSQWKKPSKSSKPVQRADLELLYLTTHLAYEKELIHIPSAHQLHLALERGWTKFAKAVFIKSDIRGVQLSGDEIRVRAALHKERAKTLERFLREDPASLRVPMPIHPSMELAIRGISDVLRTTSSAGNPEPRGEDNACLLLREFEAPGQLIASDTRYTDNLPQDLPLQQYKIWRDGGLYQPPTYTVYMDDDAAKFKQHTVMVLRTAHQDGKWPQPVTHAYTWRPAEYPAPSMRIQAFGISYTIGTTGLSTQLFGLNAPMTITEDPDVLGELKWDTPRRFTFGGRKFVWKPKKIPGKQKKFTNYKDFEVFEYTGIAPGNTDDLNDVADDASFKSIFWTGEHGERIFCVGGLDPSLKEYLIAITVLRLAIRRFSIVAAPKEEDEGTAVAKLAAGMIAQGGVTVLQLLLGS